MKRIILATIVALTATSALADEVASGIQNPGEFAPVQQGVSKWKLDRNASGYSGIQNPGQFAPVAPTRSITYRGTDEMLSGVQNPVRESTNLAGK